MTEEEFLAGYRLDKYEQPSVTADIAIFSVQNTGVDSYRHDPDKRLQVLLVRRGQHPYKGCWALPGGFAKSSETLEQCAMREVAEETGVPPTALAPVAVFSQVGRDPRGWIISHLYASILSRQDVRPVAGDDAAEAMWFDLRLEQTERETWTLELTHRTLCLKSKLRPVRSRFGQTEFEITDRGGLAFDHPAMIASALLFLRRGAQQMEWLFDFLPPRFTLTELQRVAETLTDIPTQAANFRRKVSALVCPTEEFVEGVGHRPARLYRRAREDSIISAE